jgi:hypothetical protein
MRLSQAILLSCLVSASAWSAQECPFLGSAGNDDVLARAKAQLEALEQACMPADNSELKKQLESLGSTVQGLQEKLATDIAIPVEQVGEWAGLPITCSNYSAAITNQRTDALLRLENKMNPPLDDSYAACFEAAEPMNDQGKCIHSLASDRLQAALRHCNAKRTQTQSEQMAKVVNESYRSVDAGLGQVFQNLPKDCTAFATKGSAITNSAIQLTTSLATSFAIVQPIPAAAGMGIILGANLLKQASSQLFSPKNKEYAQFKSELLFPARACLLMDLQDKEIDCTRLLSPRRDFAAKPTALTQADKDLLGDGTKPGAMQDLLNAMKATDATGSAKPEGPARPFLPALDDMDRLLSKMISNPLNTESESAQRVTVYGYLRLVSRDLKALSANPAKIRGQQEREAIGTMSARIDHYLDSYLAYKTIGRTGDAEAKTNAKENLIGSLRQLMAPVWNEELYSQHPAGGLREALDRHLENFFPPSAGLNQLRRYEFAQALLSPVDTMKTQADPQVSASYNMARVAFVPMLATQTKALSKKLREKMASYSDPQVFDPGDKTAPNMLARDFDQLAKPLLRICALLGASFYFGKSVHDVADSAAAKTYRESCEVFSCGGNGLPLFEAPQSSNAVQDLHVQQCKNAYDYQTKWEPEYARRFTNLETPGALCEGGATPPGKPAFFKGIFRKAPPSKGKPERTH